MPLAAKVLLGWMERDQAVQFLREECVFDWAITDHEAERLWTPYRERVVGLTRRVTVPQRVPLNEQEQRQVTEGLEFHSKNDTVRDIIKIDPLELVVRQHFLLIDRARGYANILKTSDDWFEEGIKPPASVNQTVDIRAGLNAVNIDVPHGEFFFSYAPAHGFGIHEFARHVTLWELQDRMVLCAGVHRMYARVRIQQADNVLMVLADSQIEGLPDTSLPFGKNIVMGTTPPVFGDFLDPVMSAPLVLRKKKYQIQVRAHLMALDAE